MLQPREIPKGGRKKEGDLPRGEGGRPVSSFGACLRPERGMVSSYSPQQGSQNGR